MSDVVLGRAEIRKVIRISSVGNVAGCFVTSGRLRLDDTVRVTRAGEELWLGGLRCLRRFTENPREVTKGFECGVTVTGFEAFEEGDVIEAIGKAGLKGPPGKLTGWRPVERRPVEITKLATEEQLRDALRANIDGIKRRLDALERRSKNWPKSELMDLGFRFMEYWDLERDTGGVLLTQYGDADDPRLFGQGARFAGRDKHWVPSEEPGLTPSGLVPFADEKDAMAFASETAENDASAYRPAKGCNPGITGGAKSE